MAFFVVWRYWGWPVWKAALLMVPLLQIEQAFLAANVLKIPEGGWLPLAIAIAITLVVLTWVRGSASLGKATRKNEAELEWLVRKLEAKPPHRVPGTAVFLTGDPYSAPTSLMHNLKHNRVLHERNIILTIKTEDTPRVPRHERIEIDRVADTFIRVIAHYGFMETPSVPKILEHCRRKDLNIDISATSFFLSRRSLQDDHEIGDAALAGAALHLAGGSSRGRHRILPHPQRPRGRGRHPGDGVGRIGAPSRRSTGYGALSAMPTPLRPSWAGRRRCSR